MFHSLKTAGHASESVSVLTLLGPEVHTCPTYKESFQVRWDNSIPLFSMLPSTLKYLYSFKPFRMHFPAKQPCTNDTVCNAAWDIHVPLTKSLFKSAGITVSHFFSMLPSTLKYLYSVEPVRMHFPAKQPCTNDTVFNGACTIAHSIICTRLFRGKMHSDWFNGIEILQGGWQHGEKVGYCYPNELEKTLGKWDIYVRLVTKLPMKLK